MIDRRAFFDAARAKPFGGAIVQQQVDGCNTIISQFEKRYPNGDPRWLAYILATTYWETYRTMQPIPEVGKGRGHPYGEPNPQTGLIYYGRGYVQLTWKANYAKLSRYVDVDLVANPELALQPDIAATILFVGMEKGLFTGRKIGNYFLDGGSDWINARRVVNVLDHAGEIAEIAKNFFAAIKTSTSKEKKMGDSNVIEPSNAEILGELKQLRQTVETVAEQAAAKFGVPVAAVQLVEHVVVNPLLDRMDPEIASKIDGNAVATGVVHVLAMLAGAAGQFLSGKLVALPAPK